MKARSVPSRRPIVGLVLLLAALAGPGAWAQSDACERPEPVCEARAAVFAVSSFDPVGSAVRIGPTRLVTARHVVADAPSATVYLADGRAIEAQVVPSDYPGDLILLESDALPPGPSLVPGEAGPEAALFTVAADVGTRRVRAFDPGRLKLAPPPGYPLARLHHDAYSQWGHSGGALVDEAGRLVGIVASGSEGRFEAVPAAAVAALATRSGPEFAAASAEIGTAVRTCALLLDEHYAPGGRLADKEAEALGTACRRSGNRQLTDLAGQTLGRDGRFLAAIALFEEGLAEDPNAVNTRIGLIVTQHLARDFEAELPHLRWLLDQGIDDLTALRLAIQAGAWAGDEELARRALGRLQEVNPEAVPAARNFLNDPPPRPAKAL